MGKTASNGVTKNKPKAESKSLVLKTIEHIVSQATSLQASTVHIEPRNSYVIVRYRVGNDLHVGTKLPLSKFEDLVLAAKKLANLDPGESRRPQEGSFKLNINNQQHTISLSTIPILDGEKILFQIHSTNFDSPSLENLGYWGASLDLIKLSLSKPHGLVVVASNGRGENAMTLLCIAYYLRNPALSLGTIEDPISYNIAHATQLEITSNGPTYSQAMQRLVNQGVNALLLSNIPDRRAAVAALTHAKKILVCASINSANASTALSQFNKIGLAPEVALSSLQLVVGQTMLKKICTSCREPFKPSAQQLRKIEKFRRSFSYSNINDMEKEARESGLGSDINDLGTSKTGVLRLWRASKRGCPKCMHSGYFGHITAAEVIDLSGSKVKSQMIKPLTLPELEKVAIKSGTIPQTIDGLIKCIRGLVDFDDVVSLSLSSSIGRA